MTERRGAPSVQHWEQTYLERMQIIPKAAGISYRAQASDVFF